MDKYKHKCTLRNWSKPCIWLNNSDPQEVTQDQVTKDWLNTNCIFVNLEHRLYLPELVIPPMFALRPAPTVQREPLFLPSLTPAEPPAEPPAPTPLSYLTPPPPPTEEEMERFNNGPIRLGVVYLEDLGPFNYNYVCNDPL